MNLCILGVILMWLCDEIWWVCFFFLSFLMGSGFEAFRGLWVNLLENGFDDLGIFLIRLFSQMGRLYIIYVLKKSYRKLLRMDELRHLLFGC